MLDGLRLDGIAFQSPLVEIFFKAPPVVQAVMIILAVASIWSWAIIISKWLGFRRGFRQVERFEKTFWAVDSLDELYLNIEKSPRSAIERIFVVGMREWRRSFRESGEAFYGTSIRIQRAMEVSVTRESDRYERGLGVLATIGSIAPFVGLFGTVWGIMNSFQAIGMQQSANLAVVAPGIAEALLATAMGLFAAIPAVAAYNYFINRHQRLEWRMEAFSDEFTALLSRQLNQHMEKEHG